MRKYDNNRIVTFDQDTKYFKKGDKTAMNVSLVDRLKKRGIKLKVEQINEKEVLAKRQADKK